METVQADAYTHTPAQLTYLFRTRTANNLKTAFKRNRILDAYHGHSTVPPRTLLRLIIHQDDFAGAPLLSLIGDLVINSKDVLSGLPAANYGYDAIVDTGNFQNRRFPRIDEATLNNSIAFAQTLVDRMSTLERNIANAGIQLEAQSPAQKQYWNSYTSADAFERSIDAILAMKASSYLVHQNCRRWALPRCFN